MKTNPTSKIPLQQLITRIYFPSLLMATGEGIVLLIIPLFAIDIGATVAGAGTVFALKGIGTVLSSVPTGVAISRLGEKKVMLFGLGLMTFAGIAASQSQTIVLLGGVTFLFGVGTGISFMTRLNYITEMVPYDQRGRALSMLGGIQRIGTFIGPILGGVFSKYFGFHVTFLIAATLALIVLALIWFILPDIQRRSAKLNSHKILMLVPRTLVEHRRAFLTAGMFSVTLQLVRAGRQLLLPLWGESIGLDTAEIGFIYGMSSAVDMSLFYVAGMILDRFGRKWAGVPCLLILSLSLVILPLAHNFVSLLLVGIMAGIGNGLGAGIIMTLGADFSPQSGRSEFLGVWRLVGDAGSAIGPVVISLLGKLFILSTASVATGFIGLLGVGLMAFFVKETMVKLKEHTQA